MMFASVALAQAPQAQPTVPGGQANVPCTVSVVHRIDLQKMIELMRDQQKLRVGVAGTAPRYIYNVTTGLVVDDLGHVVTRLSSLDPQEKEHKLTVTTGQGTILEATLIGVDLATGFAVLEVASLKAALPKIAASTALVNGSPVKILSSDVVSRSTTDKVYLAPSITVSQGHVLLDSIYSRARGALTLRSDSLLARSDSSVVMTPDNQIIGMAQYAGFGRAYLFPVEVIRDTIAKRVIDKKGNVAAGWLGVTGDSVAQLSDADFGALGLQSKAGVIVRKVSPESAAAQAGIIPSDIITRVDDLDIAGTADLKALLSSLPAGRSIKLQALRNHQPVELKAVLGAQPGDERANLIASLNQSLQAELMQREELEKRLDELKQRFFAYHKSPPSRENNEAIAEISIEIRKIYDLLWPVGADHPSPAPRVSTPVAVTEYPGGNFSGDRINSDIAFDLGFAGRDLTPQLAASLQARGGVLVSKVSKDSPADRAGLQAGDVIVGTQGGVVLNAAQLQAFLSSQHGATTLKIVRKKEAVAVSLNLQ